MTVPSNSFFLSFSKQFISLLFFRCIFLSTKMFFNVVFSLHLSSLFHCCSFAVSFSFLNSFFAMIVSFSKQFISLLFLLFIFLFSDMLFNVDISLFLFIL